MKKKDMENKNHTQLVISILVTGEPLRTGDVCQKIIEKHGMDIKSKNVSSILSKISSSDKCNLGFFIHRKSSDNGFVYTLAKEALNLSEAQLYGLTLKIGEEKYTLEQAVNDFPELKKYVKPEKLDIKTKSQVRKEAVAKKSVPKFTPPTKTVPAKSSFEDKTKKSTVPVKISEITEPVSDMPDDKSIEKLAAELIQKIDELGGLNVNLKISVSFEGLKKD